MAVVVEVKKSGMRFFLLGTGYGQYKSSRPGYIGGSLNPTEDEGSSEKVAVCSAEGEIFFMDKSSVRVVMIDGLDLNAMKQILEQN